MTQTELVTALKTLGMPVAYGEFVATAKNPPPSPPFICYIFTHSSDLMADNKNSVGLSNFQVELYTAHKDPVRERLIEDKFKELSLPYGKVEVWLNSEKMRQIIYEIQLTGG